MPSRHQDPPGSPRRNPVPLGPAPGGDRPGVPRRRRPAFGPPPVRRPGRADQPRRSWTAPFAVVLVLLGVFATGAGLGWSSAGPWSWLGGSGREPPRDFPVLEPSRPIRLSIPSIGVRAPVHRVGLADDGSIAVPELARHNETGWYDKGPTPGQFGPAIIVGHADTTTGPSVFHDLAKLRPGARVEVTRQDRSVAIFEVNSVEHFDKAALPADRVYGDTCGRACA